MNIGHNTDTGRQLKTIVERIERVREDKASFTADEKEIFAEAKGNGFDVKTIRAVLKVRATEPAKYAEAQALLELYLHAIADGGPLFESAGVPLEVDEKTRRALAKSLQGLIPAGVGSVTIEAGGATVRLKRTASGEIEVAEL